MRTLFLVFALAACGAPYRIQQQQPAAAPRLADQELVIAPLTFEMSAHTNGWLMEETPEKWEIHKISWSRKWHERWVARAAKKRLRVRTITEHDAPTSGLVVKAVVTQVRRSDAPLFSPDELTASVTIVDATTGTTVWTATIDAEAKGSGPNGYSFGGRIGWAAQTLADGVLSELTR